MPPDQEAADNPISPRPSPAGSAGVGGRSSSNVLPSSVPRLVSSDARSVAKLSALQSASAPLVEVAALRQICLAALVALALRAVGDLVGAGLFRALEQWVALQFFLDEGGELEIGKLQKLDGL